jgi:hypothetical protein
MTETSSKQRFIRQTRQKIPENYQFVKLRERRRCTKSASGRRTGG